MLQVRKRYKAELAQEHYAATLQRRALSALSAALVSAAEEQQQMVEVAAAFARRKALATAWQQWVAWMDLQQLRRRHLAALLANLDDSPAPGRQQLALGWQRWCQAVQRSQRLADLADELAGRRAAALLAQVLDVWAAYTRAMRVEPDPGSPFASPRGPGQDEALVFDLAELMAGGRGSSSEESSREESSGSPATSCGSGGKTGDGGRAVGYTSLTVAATGSPVVSMAAAETPADEAGRQQEQRKRWGLGVRFFRSTR